jgi:hypothetical protein
MSQDLIIPFIPNINHTRPMARESLAVHRITKRPIAKRDEDHRSDSEQMEALTYLDALKQRLRDNYQDAGAQLEQPSIPVTSGSLEEELSLASGLETSTVAKAVAKVVQAMADSSAKEMLKIQTAPKLESIARSKHKRFDLFV